MLDHVAEQDDVERARFERQLHRLDVADEHALAVRLRCPRRLGIELETDDRVAARGERLREIAARAADVEHAAARSDGVDELRVRAVAALVQRNVAAHAASTSSATSCSNVTVGSHPSRSRAFAALPTSV